ncbi:unnamed protein product [Ambrosiozyma monospora]|uniref:Unnamed protein product n=1 Tax=Ambrosiozyma monospora TaxID=43982 RepID=A0A9W7DLX7_AMBMO|nr:unnamed protein product [Ambrosiozyma monospora]
MKPKLLTLFLVAFAAYQTSSQPIPSIGDLLPRCVEIGITDISGSYGASSNESSNQSIDSTSNRSSDSANTGSTDTAATKKSSNNMSAQSSSTSSNYGSQEFYSSNTGSTQDSDDSTTASAQDTDDSIDDSNTSNTTAVDCNKYDTIDFIFPLTPETSSTGPTGTLLPTSDQTIVPVQALHQIHHSMVLVLVLVQAQAQNRAHLPMVVVPTLTPTQTLHQMHHHPKFKCFFYC